MAFGWGSAIGKVLDWLPGRRESLNNRIDKVKQEMSDVVNRKPFDNPRYIRLANELSKLEAQERRAS
jgi:hypothetical protein